MRPISTIAPIRFKSGVIWAPSVYADYASKVAASLWQSMYSEVFFVITSGREGRHHEHSKHYFGDAFDARSRTLEDLQQLKFQTELQKLLGTAFRVLLEKDHFHIQFIGV